MPLIEPSSYYPPKYLRNGHIQTLFASTIRSYYLSVQYQRERIHTPDADFIDVDWSCVLSDKLVILSHGIDGHSERFYMRGMVHALNEAGYDVVALNARGFSGEVNKKPHYYHAGFTDDLNTFVDYVSQKKSYGSIGLVGFSMGGNIVLKYLGEKSEDLNPIVKSSGVFSVPLDLTTSAPLFQKWSNRIYFKYIQRGLLKKLVAKESELSDILSIDDIKKADSWKDFDEHHTAPLFGFKGAEDYWDKASSLPYLEKIKNPTLIVNAEDDPILSHECYPYHIAENSTDLYLETPEHGGHVGFIDKADDGLYWSERRVINFFRSYF